jgi:hypothetical protein
MITLGFLIGFTFFGAIGLIIWLVQNSAGAHARNHRFYSELMCDHYRTRTRTRNAAPGEAYRRWPLRVLGGRPPRGTG